MNVELRDPEELFRNAQYYASGKMMMHPHIMLSMGMGIGKTVVVLTAIRDLLYSLEVSKILIVAPLLVAEETWPDEIESWAHTHKLQYEVLTGPEERRKNRAKRIPDISIINVENVTWLVDFWGDDWPYDVLVIDESSKFKNPKTRTDPTKTEIKKITEEVLAGLDMNMSDENKALEVRAALRKVKRNYTRFGSLCRVRKLLDRVYTMTGTIAPGGLMDLWSQYYLLDGGDRLGRNITQYRSMYFDKDYHGFNYIPKTFAMKAITDKIRDITITMRTEDFAELPEVIYNKVHVTLPEKVMKQYRKFEKTLYFEATDKEAVNKGVLTGQLLQLANGSIYLEDGEEYVEIHSEKLKALQELVEAANGEPVIIAYSYAFDFKRIKKIYPKAEVAGEKSNLQKRWNNGEIPILIMHPQSGGHGLNIQHGGRTIIWYGLPYSLELYQQLNRRLERPGQKYTVILHHIIARGTKDEEVMRVLPEKHATQEDIIAATAITPEELESLI